MMAILLLYAYMYKVRHVLLLYHCCGNSVRPSVRLLCLSHLGIVLRCVSKNVVSNFLQ